MAPKIYGFDRGFVCYAKGRSELYAEDTGLMWEHCVLNELHAHLQTRSINYWRDKRDNEIDFVLSNRAGNKLTAIECKFNSSSDDMLSSGIIKNFEAFSQSLSRRREFYCFSQYLYSFQQNTQKYNNTFCSSEGFAAHYFN